MRSRCAKLLARASHPASNLPRLAIARTHVTMLCTLDTIPVNTRLSFAFGILDIRVYAGRTVSATRFLRRGAAYQSKNRECTLIRFIRECARARARTCLTFYSCGNVGMSMCATVHAYVPNHSSPDNHYGKSD